jgi:hypothetical protein
VHGTNRWETCPGPSSAPDAGPSARIITQSTTDATVAGARPFRTCSFPISSKNVLRSYPRFDLIPDKRRQEKVPDHNESTDLGSTRGPPASPEKLKLMHTRSGGGGVPPRPRHTQNEEKAPRDGRVGHGGTVPEHAHAKATTCSRYRYWACAGGDAKAAPHT